jgi:hypothetical protein
MFNHYFTTKNIYKITIITIFKNHFTTKKKQLQTQYYEKVTKKIYQQTSTTIYI